MTLELIDAPAGDYRNAQFLALACDFAYLPEPQGVEAFKNELGFDAKLLSVDNTQVYVAQNDRAVVVAFRGSQSPTSLDGLKDWLLTNANNFLVLPEGRIGTDFAAAGVGAKFHRGFMQALADIWEPFYAAVEAELKRQERPLWLTGHSLGGGIALLAAWRLQQNFLPIHRVYTFGAPMIGNTAAAEAYQREFADKIFRFVDDPDPVPLLPTVSLIANSYGHCLTEMRLGALQAGAAGSAADLFKELSQQVVENVLSATLIDDIWAHLQKRIGAHDIANYRTIIAAKCKELG